MAAEETAATTTGGSGGGGDGFGAGWRDWDPPPSFDGKEDKFKAFLRDWELWKHETEVPKTKHGTKLLRNLSGTARAVADELSVAEIVSEQGADKIIACLKVHFEPHLETAMPRAFEKAVYGDSRRGRESFAEYIIRMEAAFRELAAENVKLEDNVTGYIIFRQANLSQVQEDQITTWTQGKYGKPEIVRALRRLEKVQKEKNGNRSYVTADAEAFAVDEAAEDDDSEDYVYLGDNDLNEIYEEEEVHEALNTYQQVRKAIKEQKVNRGFFNPKGYGKGFTKGKDHVGIKFGQRGAKVHVDVLKLRTRCAKCGQIGHWAKECSNEPDARGKLRAEASSSKTGYCEIGEAQSSFWGGSRLIHGGNRITLGQFLRKRPSKPSVPSTFLMTQPEFGVVDTAAQGGLIGAAALGRLEGKLSQQGLAVRWTDKVAQARGIGGEAKVCGVVEIPISIAGVSCVIEATVVEDEVPLLLSVKFLREHDAVIDLQKQQLHLRSFQRTTSLITQKSGHVAVDVCDWQGNEWEVPEISPREDMRSSDFQCSPSDRAMRGSVNWWNFSSPRAYAISSHAVGGLDAAPAKPSPGGEDREDGSGCWIGCTTGSPQLGSGASKGVRAHRPGGGPRQGWRLARKWLAVWFQCSMFLRGAQFGPILAAGKHLQGAAVQGRGLQGVDQAWTADGDPQVQDGSCGELQGLRAQGDRLAGSWQPKPARGVVQQVPSSVVGGSGGYGAAEGEERADHCGDRIFTRSQVGSFAKLPTKLPVEMLRKPAPVEIPVPVTPRNRGTFAKEKQALRSPASLLGTPSEGGAQTSWRSQCKCGKEATRLRVKKEGPTQGRHFFKCAARVCDHFEWDPLEVMEIKEAMSEEAMKEKYQEEMRQQVNITMIEAEQRHQVALQQQHQAYQAQMEHVQSQMLWLTAVAGEERLGEVMRNPQLQEQIARQAQVLRQKMMEEEQAAARSSGSF